MKDKILMLLTILFVPFFLIFALIFLAPFVLLGKLLVKGTKDEFNSDKKELLFGKKIAKSIEGLTKAGFPVKTTKKEKYTQYKIVDTNYDLEVEVNTDWVG